MARRHLRPVSWRETPKNVSQNRALMFQWCICKYESFTIAVMPRRFRRTCPPCERPRLKNLSTHLYQVHDLSPEDRKPYLKQARVSSWHPYTDQFRGEKHHHQIKMATTLGAEKKRSERQEKMTNAPVRTVETEPDQHTTETKKVELNTDTFVQIQFLYLISV